MLVIYICKMVDQEDGFYFLEFDDEFKDDIVVLFLFREGDEFERKGIFWYFKFNLRRVVIIVVVLFVLFFVIVFFVVYVWLSLINKVFDCQKSIILLRLLRYLLLIEYYVYLYFNLIIFKFFGKVDIFLYCNEVVNNIIFYVGEKFYYFNV